MGKTTRRMTDKLFMKNLAVLDWTNRDHDRATRLVKECKLKYTGDEKAGFYQVVNQPIVCACQVNNVKLIKQTK